MAVANNEEYKSMVKTNEALVKATHEFMTDLKVSEASILESSTYKHLEQNAKQLLQDYQRMVSEKEKVERELQNEWSVMTNLRSEYKKLIDEMWG